MMRALGLYLKIPMRDDDEDVDEIRLLTRPLGVKILVGTCDACGRCETGEADIRATSLPGWGWSGVDLCPSCEARDIQLAQAAAEASELPNDPDDLDYNAGEPSWMKE